MPATFVEGYIWQYPPDHNPPVGHNAPGQNLLDRIFQIGAKQTESFQSKVLFKILQT